MKDLNKVTVSVIIVTYNNKEELDECIQSIFEMNDISERLEVIVVDNSPNDSVKSRLGKYEKVKYIRNIENGFGKGNNIGYKESIGDLLIFLNPDTELIEPVFGKITNKYYNTNKCGMAGIKLLDKAGKEHNSYNIRLNYGILKKAVLRLSRKLNFFPQKIMYTCGADIIIDRKLFEEIGLFDEHIFMYGEEQDLANRINEKGKKVCFFDDLSMMHLQGMSTINNAIKVQEKMNISNKYYCTKYGIDFKKEISKEIFAMKFLNAISSLVNKKKYPDELIKSYIKFRNTH